jgi:hypothetical protein
MHPTPTLFRDSAFFFLTRFAGSSTRDWSAGAGHQVLYTSEQHLTGRTVFLVWRVKMSRIFFLGAEKVIEVKPRGYDLEKKQLGRTKEDLLQWVIAEHPEVIPWELITEQSDVAVVTVRREANVTPGSMDVLLLDSMAIPTVVEAKLFENRREIRRMMIGQALEYAANLCLEWNADRIREEGQAWWEQHNQGKEFEQAATRDRGITEPGQFWDQVDRNLREGNIRIVYICDRIPREVRRTVEFLNRFCDFEVYAVEARLYEHEGHLILTPELIGPTAADKAAKEEERVRKAGRPLKRWTRDEFLAQIGEPGTRARKVAEDLLAFGESLPDIGDPFYSPSQTGSAIFQSSGVPLYTLYREGMYMRFLHSDGVQRLSTEDQLQVIDRLNKTGLVKLPGKVLVTRKWLLRALPR